MIKKRKKKNAITLLALVITIVIMLLLAGVAIQMTMGENGLIAKSVQAQKEQAKAELYDTAKLSYTSLNAKALENGQPSPQAELALSTTEFTNKYNVVGDDITDKKGNVIDTKLNVLNVISGLKGASEDTEISMKGEYVEKPWPKKVAGVTIPEEDKDKMILKVKVLRKTEIDFVLGTTEEGNPNEIVNIDYGNGIIRDVTDYKYGRESMEYESGEYIIKIKNLRGIIINLSEDNETEILQWGKISERIEIGTVTKVYEPEPDGIEVAYFNSKFTEIPEWLFSKKVTNTYMSYFFCNDRLTSIPEGLFKNNVNVTEFRETFYGCTGLTSIPEGLFKNNVNVTNFGGTFYGCTGLTNIPEGLFKNNVNVTEFRETFKGSTGLTSIPEGLFKNNVNVTNFGGTFYGCTGLTNIPEGLFKNNVNVTEFRETFKGSTGLTSIPEGLFKNNVNVTEFIYTFGGCTGLTSIPEGLFKNNVNAIEFIATFVGCTGITSIPEGLFKNNVNATNFNGVFGGCSGITSIPEGLFKNNVNVTKFTSAFIGCKGLISIPEGLFNNNVNVINFENTFEMCTGLTSIPDRIIELGKKVREKVVYFRSMFRGCTSASNYNSIPDEMK